MNRPTFLFVGTAKAGTTSIYHYLRQHPDIAIPVKETFYFLREIYKHNHLPYPEQRPKDGLTISADAYAEIYSKLPEDKIVGEIGTGYLYHHDVSIPRIRESLGEEVKICIILRNPVERCHSAYMHFVKDLFEPLSFEASLEAEADRVSNGWDFMWHHKRMGLYHAQVEAFINAFPNVKVFTYEAFRENPEVTMNELVNFIGASPKDDWQIDKVFNPSGKAKNQALQRFITHENPLKSILRPVFRLLFGAEKRERIRKTAKAKNLSKTEGMQEKMRESLRSFYQNDITALEKLLNRSFKEWL